MAAQSEIVNRKSEMRYFLYLSYRGTRFVGWQRQPNGLSVQALLEEALTTVCREPVEVTGCGRTDAGVHALHYMAHFDASGPLSPTLATNLNGLLPPDLAVYGLAPVHDAAHARYDATERRYTYYLSLRKDPFAQELVWYYPQARQIDPEKMQAVARLLPAYEEFLPFCKTNSGLESFKCQVRKAEWKFDAGGQRLTFHISANRFLRGMVRLIVGACVGVGMGRTDLQMIREALDRQQPLSRSLSAPPHGLFLTGVDYPFPLKFQ